MTTWQSSRPYVQVQLDDMAGPVVAPDSLPTAAVPASPRRETASRVGEAPLEGNERRPLAGDAAPAPAPA